MHDIIHPDVLVEFLPAEGPALQAELDLFQQGLCGISQQGYFVDGKLISRWSASSSQMRLPSTQQRRAWAAMAVIVHGFQYSIQQLLAMLLTAECRATPLRYTRN